MDRLPQGIVEQREDGYVGYCPEAGVSVAGRTLEEAFMHLQQATWQALEREPAQSGACEPASSDGVV